MGIVEAFLVNGISLGLSAISVPGPLTAYIATVALNRGWRRALWIVISPFITDPPIILLTLLVLSQIQAVLPTALRVIQFAGGLLLWWIAWGAWRQLRQGGNLTVNDAPAAATTDEYTPRRVVQTGVMMNFISPGPYLFWSTVNGPLLLEALSLSVLHGVAFLVGFYGVLLSGIAGWGILFDRLGSVNPRFTRGLLFVIIGLLVLFGARLMIGALLP
jgi:threonine/homoserine/homoserine lactone efflux protein